MFQNLSSCSLNCAIHSPLLITTILGNALVLAAVWKTPSLRSPSVIFLCGLATTDLTVGVLLQPLFLSMELMLLPDSSTYHGALGYAFIAVSYTVCGASLMTLTTSVDRLLALRYHMRYTSIVTARRALCAIALNWLTSWFLASLILWSPNIVFLLSMALAVAIFLCLSTSAHLYIYRVVRRHKQQIAAQANAVQDRSCVNVARFKRTAAITFLVHYFLLICYTPLFVALLLTGINEERKPSESWERNGSAIAWKLTSPVLFTNSALNPFIYCWRLREICTAVKKAFFCRK